MGEAFDGIDAIVELIGPILFHTEFGISSILGGQTYLQRYSYLKVSSASMLLVRSTKLRFTHRVTEVSAHALAAGHWNHFCWTPLSA